MHRPHRRTVLLRSRRKATRPAAVGIIHRITAGPRQQKSHRAADTIAAEDVSAHLEQCSTELGIGPTGNVLDLDQVGAHYGAWLEKGDPEPTLAKAQRAQQRSPTLVQVVRVADRRHLTRMPKCRDVSHGSNVVAAAMTVASQALRYPQNLWMAIRTGIALLMRAHEVVVFGMSLEPVTNERTEWSNIQTPGTRVVECTTRDL